MNLGQKQSWIITEAVSVGEFEGKSGSRQTGDTAKHDGKNEEIYTAVNPRQEDIKLNEF